MGRLSASSKGNKEWIANITKLGEFRSSSTIKTVRIETLASMAAVRKLDDECRQFQGSRRGKVGRIYDHLQTHVVDGDRAKADKAVTLSDCLIDKVMAMDPRLARRPQWTRSDDGIFADAGLVASGDDSPCYQMTRHSLREATGSLDPIKVAVSTDSGKAGSLVAFVAVVRIVQQFRPVHVWWQGAWLADDRTERGYVFHAPIVTGDMDFARLQFVISDKTRDWASFGVLHQLVNVRDKTECSDMGRHADFSYLPGAHYVGKSGIAETPDMVARTACRWLGIDSPLRCLVNAEDDATAALQTILTDQEPWNDDRTDEEKRSARNRDMAYRLRLRAEEKEAAEARRRDKNG